MQTLTTKLYAGQRMPFKIAGSVLFIQSADQGQNLVVRFFTGNAQSGEVDQVGASFKAKPPTPFDGIDMLAPVDTNVTFIIADGDIDFQLPGIGVIVTNSGTNPVPVEIVSEPGAPFPVTITGPVTVTGATLTATNVGINNTTANPVPVLPMQASTITDAAPQAVAAFTSGTPNQVHIRAAGACRSLRISNPAASAGKLFIGGAGVTPTNAVIVLLPGDVWNETDAPQVDWYATSDTGATANMQVIA
ncbi:hypothetical protein BLA13014_00424 [Burkholderia aenigmatica]|uniref:Uncharacterized protein n=1 Tax=Burkholderia aenigmatica TaxID=2015348 RepID=A0A6P2HCV5_9BURK|nr:MULTISPECIES: hypothetical protein [Burkholderia]VWB15304.1 hypothetical protein BLA13014_00424 [Burkholderia aenigmatica]